MDERERIWRERIAWQQQSGMTVVECCDVEGVSVASFYRWKKLIEGTVQPRIGRGEGRAMAASPSFVPITLRPSGPDQKTRSVDSRESRSQKDDVHTMVGSLRVEFPNGVVIHLPLDLDGQRLGDVILAAGQIQTGLPAVISLQRSETSSC